MQINFTNIEINKKKCMHGHCVYVVITSSRASGMREMFASHELVNGRSFFRLGELLNYRWTKSNFIGRVSLYELVQVGFVAAAGVGALCSVRVYVRVHSCECLGMQC